MLGLRNGYVLAWVAHAGAASFQNAELIGKGCEAFLIALPRRWEGPQAVLRAIQKRRGGRDTEEHMTALVADLDQFGLAHIRRVSNWKSVRTR